MADQKAPPAQLETGPMTDDVLRGIFASDQDMYPAPLTWDRLEGWTRAAPEMALCFYLPDEPSTRSPVGAVSALPLLASSWHDLLVGKIKETDVEPELMFPRADDDNGPEVGLHVFHVERFDTPEARGRVRGFADLSMRAVVEAAGKKGWKVVGHSATPEGRRCFEKMGFEPTGYEELWVASDSAAPGGVQLVTVSADAAAESNKIAEGFGTTVKGHARMLAKHRV